MGIFMLGVVIICCLAVLLAVLSLAADTDGVFTSNILITSAAVFFLTSSSLYDTLQQLALGVALAQLPHKWASTTALISGLFVATTFRQLLGRDPLGKLLERGRRRGRKPGDM